MEMAVARTPMASMSPNIRMMAVPRMMSPRRGGYLFVYRRRPPALSLFPVRVNAKYAEHMHTSIAPGDDTP